MKRLICDICEKNVASTKYKCKRMGILWIQPQIWREVDICEECAEKLLGINKK